MEMLFALFGGLAMFLYGMDRMSRALQRAAGDAMKRLLARLTATPLLGVLTGLAVTAVLQSSSAATVMVIGFVSAGLLELPRAVAVIYGINIGTTMTAQLIAFDVQTLVYPVLFLGFLLDFAACRPRWRAVGEAVFSFGLLFEGIDILGRALQPLAGQAVFLDWMTRVKESPLLGILLGLSMTMVVQSSSATIALLQNVARQAGPDGIHSVLGLAGAVPVLLGDNIGTTVTALLACIGQGKDAARAALAHSCFNLSGSLLAAVLLAMPKTRKAGTCLACGLVLDLLLAILFSRWFTNPIRKLSNGAQEIASGNYDVMAAVMIGGMTPPCAIALATMLFPNKFTKQEREAGPTNFIMGLAFITEGAIPYAASDPLPVIPACVIGSGIAGAMSMAFKCTLMAPHGGIFVVPVIGNPWMYLIALVVGMAVSTVLLGVLKKKIR